ncbi:RES family NAD+ phosphorylase [Flagellimonas amoyensis]|uniref:RES family NAD+ phosphorylase n=1 Tax=Flagellimonas amoyensis TaxID=2169401 RepID=UPI000D3799AC|nr:RES family NAD+ phosphorylase [Allomuricauda amoyensis]
MVYYRLYQDSSGRTSTGYGTGGARWNKKGTPVIYCASSISIATFEILTIMGSKVSSNPFIIATVEVTGVLNYIREIDLPKDWNAIPRPTSTQEIGTAWAKSMNSLGLMVPSARLPLSAYPNEHNLLINPLSSDFATHFNVIKEEKFIFNLGS